MSYYCHLASPGNPENYNLQLYSLDQAAINWNNLLDDIDAFGINNDMYKEKLVFILNCLGLSLSQLLGQNVSSPNNTHIDPPLKLFNTFINSVVVPSEKQKIELQDTFEVFNKNYNAVRHFGVNKGNKKYKIVDALTIEKLHQFFLMTIEIWDIAISNYRKKPDSDIDSFDSISDVINFQV